MRDQICARAERGRSAARQAAIGLLIALGFPGVLAGVELASSRCFSASRCISAPASLLIPAAFAESPAGVKLPGPQFRGPMSLAETLQRRRSTRTFANDSLSLADVSQLLWSGQGITSAQGGRTAPSAGALYPLDLFLVAGRVSGLSPGVYRYEPAHHALARTAAGDRRAALGAAALHQACVRSAPAAIVITGTYGRTAPKYGQRGARYVLIEAGCAAENICLSATALGLGSVMVGAFEDRQVGRELALPSEAEPLLIVPVGRPVEHDPW